LPLVCWSYASVLLCFIYELAMSCGPCGWSQ